MIKLKIISSKKTYNIYDHTDILKGLFYAYLIQIIENKLDGSDRKYKKR